GAGKSHFLSVVQDRARQAGWATCHVECKVDGVQIDRFETLYPKIASKLTLPGSDVVEDDSGAAVAPTRLLLERWTAMLLRTAGTRPVAVSRPFDADERLYAKLQSGLMRTNLPADFTRALVVHSRATLARDFDTVGIVAQWLGGAEERVSVPTRYLH